MKWIDDLTVGRKLFVAFATVLAAIAVMGVVVGLNLMALTRAGEDRSLENKINQATAAAEFYMARQENSFRGYLVTGDGYYLERIEAHRANFRAKLEELAGELPAGREGPASKAEEAADVWHQNVVGQAKALIAAGRGAEALALARLQHGKTKEAREAFVLLQLGQDVPDSIRQRAQIAVESIDAGTAAAIKPIIDAAAKATPPAAGAANAMTPSAAQAAPAQAEPAQAAPAQAAPAQAAPAAALAAQ